MKPTRIDLENHISITSADIIQKLIRPIADIFQIKHFRYLRLYHDGQRILLSNEPHCTRFFYQEGHYKQMWFDGEFPENLVAGWHSWDMTRVLKCNNEITPFEKEIHHQLGLAHGITYIEKGLQFIEVYTFDSPSAEIYSIEYKNLQKFIAYFKEQAARLIKHSEREKIIVPEKKVTFGVDTLKQQALEKALTGLRLSRYYLSGPYRDVYLTTREAQCAYWLIQGKSTEEIALIENTSAKTIMTHLDKVRQKLGCNKQTQVVRILLENNFLNIFTL